MARLPRMGILKGRAMWVGGILQDRSAEEAVPRERLAPMGILPTQAAATACGQGQLGPQFHRCARFLQNSLDKAAPLRMIIVLMLAQGAA